MSNAVTPADRAAAAAFTLASGAWIQEDLLAEHFAAYRETVERSATIAERERFSSEFLQCFAWLSIQASGEKLNGNNARHANVVQCLENIAAVACNAGAFPFEDYALLCDAFNQRNGHNMGEVAVKYKAKNRTTGANQ